MRIWVLALLAACGGSDVTQEYELHGTAQKGPFALGSTVMIQELDDQLRPTGRSYFTETNDALGNFEAPTAITSQYVEVLVTGNFLVEAFGTALGSTTSRVIADLSNTSCGVNVNLLTHLQGLRLLNLVQGGMSFSEADVQSSVEVLTALHMPTLKLAFGAWT